VNGEDINKIGAQKFAKALKKVTEASEIIDMPAFVLGSKSDPSFSYGVFICSREVLSEILKISDDFEIIGMLRSTTYRDLAEQLH